MITIKIQQLFKNILIPNLLLILLISVLSCRTNDDTIRTGIGILKVNMKGAQFPENSKGMLNKNASASPLMRGIVFDDSNEVEIAKIPLKDDYFMIATLSSGTSESITNFKASANTVMPTTTTITKLQNGIKYRLVVYDSDGALVDQKVYTTGNNTPDDGQDLKLNGGSTYKFVVYSYNDKEAPIAVTPTNSTSYDISGNQDFMYFTTDMVVTGETTNYLDVVMMHKYTKLNITIDTSEIGTVDEISGVTITPHHVSNKVDLTNGQIIYDNKAVIAPVTLSGAGSAVLEGESLVSAPETTIDSPATLTIGSITVNGVKQTNKEVNFNLIPGVNTNLTLKVQKLVVINVMQIASSYYHTIALTPSGDVYGTGHISYGELGAEASLQQKPVKRGIFSEWYVTRFNKLNINNAKKIAVSDGATYVLKKTGELYVAGLNNNGQLGIGSTTNTGTKGNFIKVDFFGGTIKDIVGGEQMVFILTEDGKVFGAGKNDVGQLGVGDFQNKTNFVEVKGLENYKVEQITAGQYHVIVKTTSGKIFGAGYEKWAGFFPPYNKTEGYGQLGGIGNTNTFKEIPFTGGEIKSINAGKFTSFIVTTSGQLFATGYNAHGELGIGMTKNQYGFVGVNSINNVKEIRSHNTHTIVITNSGQLYATGDNQYGQLGLGDTRGQTSFVRISTMASTITYTLEGPTADHTIVISSTGQVYGAGNNDYSVLGLGTINARYLSFKDLPLQTQ